MATRISPLVLRELSLLWSVRLAFHGASVEKLKASSTEEPWTVKARLSPRIGVVILAGSSITLTAEAAVFI